MKRVDFSPYLAQIRACAPHPPKIDSLTCGVRFCDLHAALNKFGKTLNFVFKKSKDVRIINDVECVEMKCSRSGCGYFVTVFSEHSSIQGALSWLDYEEDAEHNHEFDGSDLTKEDKDKMDKIEKRRKKLRKEEYKNTEELHKDELHKQDGSESPLFLLSEEEPNSSPVQRTTSALFMSSESEIEVTDVIQKPKKSRKEKQHRTLDKGAREKRSEDLESARKSASNGTTEDTPTQKPGQKTTKQNGKKSKNGPSSNESPKKVAYISLDSDSDSETIIAPKRKARVLQSPDTPQIKKQKISSKSRDKLPSKSHNITCKFCSRVITANADSTLDDLEHALMVHVQIVHPMEAVTGSSHVTKKSTSHVTKQSENHVTDNHVTGATGHVSEEDVFFEAEDHTGSHDHVGESHVMEGHVRNTTSHVTSATSHVTQDHVTDVSLVPREVGEPGDQSRDSVSYIDMVVSRDPKPRDPASRDPKAKSHDLRSRDIVTISDSSSDPEYYMSEEVEQYSDLESAAPETEADRIRNAIRNAAKKVMKTAYGNYGTTKMAQRVIANGKKPKDKELKDEESSDVDVEDIASPDSPEAVRPVPSSVTPARQSVTPTVHSAAEPSSTVTTPTPAIRATARATPKARAPATHAVPSTATRESPGVTVSSTATATTPTIDAISGVSTMPSSTPVSYQVASVAPTTAASSSPTMTSRTPSSGITPTALAAAAPVAALVPSGQPRPVTSHVTSTNHVSIPHHVTQNHTPQLTQHVTQPMTNPALALQERVRQQVQLAAQPVTQPMTNQPMTQPITQPMTNQLNQLSQPHQIYQQHVTSVPGDPRDARHADHIQTALATLHTRHMLTNQRPNPTPNPRPSQFLSNQNAHTLSLYLKNSRKWHSVFSLLHRGAGVAFLCYAHLLGIKLAQCYPEVLMVDRVNSAIEVGGVDATGSYFPICFAHNIGSKDCTEGIFEWLQFVYGKNGISNPHVIVSSYNLIEEVKQVFPHTAVILERNVKTRFLQRIDGYMHFGHVKLVPGVLKSLDKIEKDVMLAFKQNESRVMGFYSQVIAQQRYERIHECVHPSFIQGIVSHKAIEYMNHAVYASKKDCKGGGWPHDVTKCEKQATGMPCPVLLTCWQSSREVMRQLVHSHWHLMTEEQEKEEVGEATSQIVYPEMAKETEEGWTFA